MIRFTLLRRWARDTSGQDLLEYALLAGVLSLGIYSGASGLGQSMDGWYSAMDDSVADKRQEASQITSADGGISIGPLDRQYEESTTKVDCTSGPGNAPVVGCQ